MFLQFYPTSSFWPGEVPSVEHSEYAQQLSSLTAVLRLHDDHVHVLRTEIKLSYIQYSSSHEFLIF